MADVAHEENVIEKDERSFIHSIIDFGDTVTREVMTPRPDMVTVEADVTVRDALEAALGAGYSRIPVEADGIDDIIGIAYAKDLVRAERVGQGRTAGARQRAAGQVHPRVQGGLGPPARDAGGEVPHGDRRRRVRRHGRADHARGPARGAGGRHRRRVRRRGAHGGAPRRTARCSSSAALLGGRRRRAPGRRPPARPLGHGGRAHAGPGRPGARPRATRWRWTGSA